jgi:hypothetical protein
MKLLPRSLMLFAVIWLLMTQRLPAPIQEIPESPTPAPVSETTTTPIAKPKVSKTKEKAAELESREKERSSTKVAPISAPAHQGPARFAGMWKGKINQGLLGHTPTTLRIDPAATLVELSRNLGGGSRPLTISGNSASWKTGVVGEIVWTLTPNSDGQTAQVTMKGVLVHDTTTFRRGSAPAVASVPAR